MPWRNSFCERGGTLTEWRLPVGNSITDPFWIPTNIQEGLEHLRTPGLFGPGCVTLAHTVHTKDDEDVSSSKQKVDGRNLCTTPS